MLARSWSISWTREYKKGQTRGFFNFFSGEVLWPKEPMRVYQKYCCNPDAFYALKSVLWEINAAGLDNLNNRRHRRTLHLLSYGNEYLPVHRIRCTHCNFICASLMSIAVYTKGSFCDVFTSGQWMNYYLVIWFYHHYVVKRHFHANSSLAV